MGLRKNFLGSSSSMMSYMIESCIEGEESEDAGEKGTGVSNRNRNGKIG